jgi:hypothetical protein
MEYSPQGWIALSGPGYRMIRLFRQEKNAEKPSIPKLRRGMLVGTNHELKGLS